MFGPKQFRRVLMGQKLLCEAQRALRSLKKQVRREADEKRFVSERNFHDENPAFLGKGRHSLAKQDCAVIVHFDPLATFFLRLCAGLEAESKQNLNCDKSRQSPSWERREFLSIAQG